MFKKIIAAVMAVTLCTSGIAAAGTGIAGNFASITASAAFQSYIKAFPAGTVLYKAPGSSEVAMVLSTGGSFTIVEEQTVNGIVYGKFKSGAGWAVVGTAPLNEVPYTKAFPAGTKLYKEPGSGEISMTLSQGSVFTIVEEKAVGSTVYGKFKSGAGWAVISGPAPDPVPDPDPVGKITTDEIIAVCHNLGYDKGSQYWTTNGNTKITTPAYRAVSVTNRPYGSNGYNGYQFSGGIQCYAFALYLMSRVTYLKTDDPIVLSDSKPTGGWTYLTASQVTDLRVGDIVRTGTNNEGHSAVVLSVDANGNCKFVECWGGKKCKNLIGYNCGFNGQYNTLYQLKNTSSPRLSYVLRYNG